MLKYISGSTGKTISLYSEFIKGRLRKAGFYDYDWDVNTIDKILGCEVESFGKKPKKYELILDFIGNQKKRSEYADLFFENVELDVLNKTPGRLYFRGYFLNCFVIASEAGGRDDRKKMVQKKATVYAPYPFWIKEETYYIPAITADIPSKSIYVKNKHFAPFHYILKAYGPFESLEYAIDRNLVKVNAACAEGEYITLNSKEETITKTDQAGNQTNIYSLQDFSLDTFRKIQGDILGISSSSTGAAANKVLIQYGRAFDMELTFLLERSEPKWSEEEDASEFLITTESEHPLMTEDGFYLIGGVPKSTILKNREEVSL